MENKYNNKQFLLDATGEQTRNKSYWKGRGSIVIVAVEKMRKAARE
jgi:hypothetical protein